MQTGSKLMPMAMKNLDNYFLRHELHLNLGSMFAQPVTKRFSAKSCI